MIGGVRLQRSGMPLLVLAAILLIGAAVVVFLLYDPFDWIGRAEPAQPSNEPAEAGPQPVTATPSDEPGPAPAEPAPKEQAAPAVQESTPVAQPAATSQQAASTHTVRRGDTLSALAELLWDNPYLWPALLAANNANVGNPDLLRPGQSLKIPMRPVTRADSALIDAHVLAYQRYREYGDRAIEQAKQLGNSRVLTIGRNLVNKSHWVLYSGLRFDPTFIDRYGADIDPTDAHIVEGFVMRFGLPTDK